MSLVGFVCMQECLQVKGTALGAEGLEGVSRVSKQGVLLYLRRISLATAKQMGYSGGGQSCGGFLEEA